HSLRSLLETGGSTSEMLKSWTKAKRYPFDPCDMAFYAIDRIDDAVDMTRSFLLPIESGRWLRLVVVVAFLFVGGGGGSGTFSAGGNAPASTGSMPGGAGPDFAVEFPEITATAMAVVLGLIAIGLVVGLLVGLIGAIMEFVFVESLSSDEIHVRSYFSRYTGKGLHLFAFRLLLGIVALVVFGGALLLVFGNLIASALAGDPVTPSAGRIVLGVLVFLPLGIGGGVLLALANGLTTQFVVPIMLKEDRDLLEAWRRFWPTLTGQWKQYAVYVLIAFGLTIVTEIAAGIVIGIAGILLAIPFGIVAIPVGIGVLEGGALTFGVVVLLGILLAVYLLVLWVAAATVYVPIKVFLRQFALLVLGDTNEDFDVLGDRRPVAGP
ncbi:MAG: DUF7544 domain-containing protein, partial [Halorhabdus sp.]